MEKIRKKIGFNFYTPKLLGLEKTEEVWEMGPLLDYIEKTESFRTTCDIKNDKIEIEPNSIIKKENVYFFQISKLREDNIPAKKREGKEKIEFELEDDEYIGEFNGVLYDPQLSVIVLQINKAGVSISEAESYLKELRKKYFSECLKKEQDNKMVKLDLIIDTEKLKNIDQSKEIRKFTIKSDTIHLAALEDKDAPLKQITKALNNFGDVEFEITIKAIKKPTESGATIKKDIVTSVIKCYEKLKGTKKLEVTRKENSETNVEEVDFLLPKLSEYRSIQLEPRKSVGKEDLRVYMLESYNNQKEKIKRIKNKR